MLEGLLESQRRPRAQVLEIVGDEQATAAVGMLAEHIELDHVHPVTQRRVEARQRVPRLDVRGPLVTDALGARGDYVAAVHAIQVNGMEPRKNGFGLWGAE